MKQLMCVLSVIGISSISLAEIVYVPGGDFSSALNWEQASGGSSGATYTFSGGYGQVDSTAGSWAVMVATSTVQEAAAFFRVVGE